MNSRTNALLLITLLSIAVSVFFFGCGGPPSPASEAEAPSISGKVPVEAYLFDVVIRRHGKPTSLRLDVFDADSVVALGGRAYLGKGALRGRLTKDSLIAFFPTSNEYLREDFATLSISGEHRSDFSKLGLSKLLRRPPDTGAIGDSARVELTFQDTGGNSKWIAYSGNRDRLDSAKWLIQLSYCYSEDSVRLYRFSYTDSTLTITANRREYRSHARVPSSRFRVAIPSTATPIIP